MDTIWQLIFKRLKEDGIEVYPPATHKGECINSYCVIKENGSSKFQNFSSEVSYYSLSCYVPYNKYHELSQFCEHCNNSIEKLFPTVKFTGEKTPDFYDDTVKGYMRSLQYSNYSHNRKI